jgi:hypothetical protein
MPIQGFNYNEWTGESQISLNLAIIPFNFYNDYVLSIYER